MKPIFTMVFLSWGQYERISFSHSRTAAMHFSDADAELGGVNLFCCV